MDRAGADKPMLRRAAMARAVRNVSFWPIGCLGCVRAAWPAAFDDMGAGDLVRLVRAGDVDAALDAAFGGRIALAAPGDPVVILWAGRRVAGLAMPSAVLITNKAGIMALDAPVQAAWPAFGCRSANQGVYHG